MPIMCRTCQTGVSPTWWKCCPKHTTEQGTDVVCQSCASGCLAEKEIVKIDNKSSSPSLNQLQEEMIIKQQNRKHK